MEKKHDIVEIIGTLAAIVGCIAAILVIPEIRQAIGLEQSVSFTIPTQTTTLLLSGIDTETVTAPQIQPTATFRLPVRSISHRQISENVTEEIILASNQVAIGTADRFEDLLHDDYPPFTIFVLYGAANTQLSLFWGGWDLWENASESFIDEQVNTKIQEVISGHPTDYDKRGYRVIKCYSQVENCEVINSFP